MARQGSAVIAVALAAAIYFYSRDASAAVTYYDDGSAELPDDATEPIGGFSVDDPGTADQEPVWTDVTDPDSMLQAFLYMLKACEHSAQDVANGDAYRTFYGGTKFSNYADHPVLTGELKGVPLPAQMCINAGIASGNCVSTAAGAYQATVPTWNEIRNYGGPSLPDFSPASQDEFARRLLAKIGALALIQSGDIDGAIAKAGKRWASLPGAVAKQGQRSLDFAHARFNDFMDGSVA